MNGESQLLYSSDYPRQYLDLPTQAHDLSFVSDQARRGIVGRNVLKLIGLPVPVAGPVSS
jgi:predicted TIM-barrel fold metal-dependent hydrolase